MESVDDDLDLDAAGFDFGVDDFAPESADRPTSPDQIGQRQEIEGVKQNFARKMIHFYLFYILVPDVALKLAKRQKCVILRKLSSVRVLGTRREKAMSSSFIYEYQPFLSLVDHRVKLYNTYCCRRRLISLPRASHFGAYNAWEVQ